MAPWGPKQPMPFRSELLRAGTVLIPATSSPGEAGWIYYLRGTIFYFWEEHEDFFGGGLWIDDLLFSLLY